MFRIIHPNRWFFWTISLLLGLGLFIVWQVQKNTVNPGGDQFIPADSGSWRRFSSDTLKLSIRYPATWQIEIDPEVEHSVFLENSENYHENISIAVREPSIEPAIRLSLNTVAEKPITVDGESGRWLRGDDQNDEATSNVVFVNHAGKLYYFAGTARVFEEIVGSVKFLP